MKCSSVTMLNMQRTLRANQTQQVPTLTPDTNCQMLTLGGFEGFKVLMDESIGTLTHHLILQTLQGMMVK